MMAGAAMSARRSTALMPQAVFQICTMAKIAYHSAQFENPVRYSTMPLMASAPR